MLKFFEPGCSITIKLYLRRTLVLIVILWSQIQPAENTALGTAFTKHAVKKAQYNSVV